MATTLALFFILGCLCLASVRCDDDQYHSYVYVGRGLCTGPSFKVKDDVEEVDCATECHRSACLGYSYAAVLGRCAVFGPGLDEGLPQWDGALEEWIGEWMGQSHDGIMITLNEEWAIFECKRAVYDDSERIITNAGVPGWIGVQPDIPFVPTVYFDGTHHPVCFNDDSDSDGASKVCQAAGFLHGGQVQKKTSANRVRDQNAKLIDNYIGEDGVAADEKDLPAQCKAGAPVNEIVCNYQCRRFPTFNEEYLPNCHPYLDNSTNYYLADTPWIDDPSKFGFSLISGIIDVVENAMNPVCASNVAAYICRTNFRQCQQVDDMWVPSLLCRGECERHWETWSTCLDALEADPGAKANFDRQMAAVVEGSALASSLFFGRDLPKGTDNSRSPFRLLECDTPASNLDTDKNSVLAWIHGRWPEEPTYWGRLSLHFPVGLDSSTLYPEVSTLYTLPDSTTREVACFVPGEITEIPQIECPHPFVNPLAIDHVESCIQPCPVQAYTDEEYTLMWGVSMGVGLVGFALNFFMASTWLIAGKRAFSQTPYQLKACVILGLLYAMVGTLPSLLLKYDLACECETEECTGSSTLCMINRASTYILLAILIHLCLLTHNLYSAITEGNQTKKVKNALNFAAALASLLLPLVGYALDDDSDDVDNAKLNIARHSFSCSMRFPDMTTEWLALWVHFLWSGSLTMAFALGSWREIGAITKSAKSVSESAADPHKKFRASATAKSQRRLLRIAGMVSTCLLLNGIANLSTAAKLQEWNRTAELSLACAIKERWNTRDWNAYGFRDEVVNVCSQESAIEVQAPCVSDCFWYPDIADSGLTCHDEKSSFESLDARAEEYREQREAGLLQGPGQHNVCDCDCSQLIQIERPSVALLSLAHLSQSLVVVIVGLNLGFRDENIEHWKKFFRSKGLSTNKVAAGSAQSSKCKSGSPHAVESVVGDHDYE